MTVSIKKGPVLAAAVLSAAGLTACGSADHESAATPPPTNTPQPQNLDTAQVLALAQKPSETAEPMDVNAGMVELIDTSDNTQPITVNGQ